MVTTLLVFAVGVVLGAAFSYLFLRANPKDKAVLDKWTDEQSDKLK